MQRPDYYSPNCAGDLYLPRYDLIEEDVKKLRKDFKPAENDKIALFIIDAQISFCMPGASLYVPGAEKDVGRLCDFGYRNMENIARIYLSLDQHTVHQIFHAAFWQDAKGNNPEPFTVISYNDLEDGRWFPRFDFEFVQSYVSQLEEACKYKLAIWPYHGQKGSVDSSLLPILSEMVHLHSRLYGYDPAFIEKGKSRLTESYSVFNSEIGKLTSRVDDHTLDVGESYLNILDALMTNERIYIAGEASSHCVLATLEDMIRNVKNPELLKKVYILEDCMSPVAAIPGIDFPSIAKQAMERFKKIGMNIVRSTDKI